jgi:DNA transformation protein
MAKTDGFKDFILDQLADLRGLTCRAMFGGYGLYHRRKFFGVIHKSRLYFKVTSKTIGLYRDQGMKPFRPNPKQTLRSFYEVPAQVIEDTDLLIQWAFSASRSVPRYLSTNQCSPTVPGLSVSTDASSPP